MLQDKHLFMQTFFSLYRWNPQTKLNHLLQISQHRYIKNTNHHSSMEVQARHHHLNQFLPQIFSNREFAATDNVQTTGHVSNTTHPTAANTIPMYGFPTCMSSDDAYEATTNPRKRPRDYNYYSCSNNDNSFGFGYYNATSLFGEDVAFHLHQQQSDIDQFVSQHTEKVRTEIQQRRSRYSKLIAQAVEHSITKRLRAKEEELIRICRLNLDLEERVRSLTAENQLWRDMAQAADALRKNLEDELAQRQSHVAEQLRSESESESCGSSSDRAVDGGRRRAEGARVCRRCEAEESCVLVLPCRHLCLCATCGSSMHTCPVCDTIKTCSVRVNI